MNASNTFENEFLKLLFQNIAVAGIGDIAGILPSASAGDLYIRLCTDGVVVDDSTVGTECTYTGYIAGGVGVTRGVTTFAVTDNQVENATEIVFGACTATPDPAQTATYAEVWRNDTDDTEPYRVAWVTLVTPLSIISGITPKFDIGGLVFTFD